MWQAVLLGLVQGLTEFLPVSSSGHLALFEHVLGWKNPEGMLAFNIALHLGSLLAVILFVGREIKAMFTTEPRLMLVVIVGTLPVALAGIPLKHAVETLSTNLVAVGALFFVTAMILLFASRVRTGEIAASRLSYRRTLAIGIAQIAAVLPGISRSGTTLAAGLKVGLEPSHAVKYAFLLAIPAIAGAGLMETLHGRHGEWTSTMPAADVLVGVVISFLASLLAMKLLMKSVLKGKLGWFSAYCLCASAAAFYFAK